MLFAAVGRLRSRRLWVACAAYTAILVIELVTHRGRYEVVASTAPAILTLGGSVHALRIREAVFFGA